MKHSENCQVLHKHYFILQVICNLATDLGDLKDVVLKFI